MHKILLSQEHSWTIKEFLFLGFLNKRCCLCYGMWYDKNMNETNIMNEKQTVWVVSEFFKDYHFGYTNTTFNIIGIYTEKSIAKEVYNRSINYSIEEVELNK